VVWCLCMAWALELGAEVPKTRQVGHNGGVHPLKKCTHTASVMQSGTPAARTILFVSTGLVGLGQGTHNPTDVVVFIL